jgi:meiotically up-regulated gene 157 (Mug157) protein
MRQEISATLRVPSVYRTIEEIAGKLEESEATLARTFRQCYPNTLETTTELLPDGTTFVFTGDIRAMWLRDSSAQVRPYVPLAAADPELARVIRGLIKRQAQYILIDAYANAFNREPDGRHNSPDRTEMGPWIWERKFELDSLCYPIQLLQDYWAATGDGTVFDQVVYGMLRRIVEVMCVEQQHDRSPYYFERHDDERPLDTLPLGGRGTRTNYTGMVWSGFRPSDDACTFGYHIPSNMFAVVVLGHVARFAAEIYADPSLATRALQLQREIDFGIRTYGRVEHPHYGRIYAYETDGFGNHLLMDDANVPSLLSIPYLGYRPVDDPDYQRTRAFVLSRDNPYYVEGAAAKGIGSPHTPVGYVWPLALTMQGLTSTDPSEQRRLLEVLVSTTAGTGYMHESFDPDDPERYTRAWFAWANSLFGDFVVRWVRGGGLQGR